MRRENKEVAYVKQPKREMFKVAISRICSRTSHKLVNYFYMLSTWRIGINFYEVKNFKEIRTKPEVSSFSNIFKLMFSLF